MEKEALISIIVPVYNVKAYLKKCLDSIRAQTYQNLEIIVVDDGSTDGSGQMCDEYAYSDDRFKVIHKDNGGVSDARNSALDVMNGEYLTFIDSDDYVSKNYIECLYRYAVEEACDLVIGSYLKVCDDSNECKIQNFSCHIYTRREIMTALLYGKVPMYSHGKLYKSYLFDVLRFPKGKLYEDVITTWNVVKQVESAVYINPKLYFYRQRDGSIVHAVYSHSRLDSAYWILGILDELKNDSDLYKAAASKYFFVLTDNYALISDNYAEDKRFLEKEIKKYRKIILCDKNSDKPLRVLALLAYLPIGIIRVAGKGYKKCLNFSYRVKWIRK